MREILQSWEAMARVFGLFGGAIIIALAGHYIIFKVAEGITGRTQSVLDTSLVKHFRGPFRVIIPLFVVRFVLPLLEISPTTIEFVKNIFSLCFIASFAWLIVRMTLVLDDIILTRYRIDVKDNLQARKIQTQLQIFKKIVIVVVTILALATMLMTFEKVRQLGTTILASAGIVGIVVGLAAQRTIATLLAGLQIAITQPIRVDDVVIVENEWGRIEEITFTYAVVRIWDLRRLVLPITYFIEKPFQNWTRVTADILGTVFLYVDYTVPVQAIREELHRILKNTDLWDGKAWVLHVTNATERTVELRALMSAQDAPTVWNLRCEVREKLLEFIRKNYPDGLPKVRAEIRESVIPASDMIESKS
ncbi:MAG: mechanosensitive ion channel [Syntrophobacterales bacterium]|nr:MAG: mechanosensitive ion channel [Syntrophobacterales bacterium]